MMQSEVVEKLVAKAVASFVTLAGRMPTDREIRSIANKIAARLDAMPLPKGEFPRSRTPEALWWHQSSIRMHSKLLRHEPAQAWVDQTSAIRPFGGKLAEPPAYNFKDDQEVVGIWTGSAWIDPNDGAEVIFGRNQWVDQNEGCTTLFAE